MNVKAFPVRSTRPRSVRLAAWCAWLGLATALLAATEPPPTAAPNERKLTPMGTNSTELATLGGGCFWCLEALYQRLDGVVRVTSGYAGGTRDNPTYKEVCSGNTGHAEVIQVEFDPRRLTYEQLLEFFWEAHDPTTLNQQGADHGTQYRSIILTCNPAQQAIAEKSRRAAAAHFSSPIVTEIVALTRFYRAEGYHQDYYNSNANAPYCRLVISPKLEKLRNKIQPSQ